MNSLKVNNVQCNKDKKCIVLLPFGRYNNDLTYLEPLLSSDKYILVAAGGNDGRGLDLMDVQFMPGCHPNVIGVGSYRFTGRNIVRADHSNYGNNINIYAPGEDIITTGHSNLSVINQGTSFAAAHVAGWLALLSEKNDTLNMSDILSEISNLPQIYDKVINMNILTDMKI